MDPTSLAGKIRISIRSRISAYADSGRVLLCFVALSALQKGVPRSPPAHGKILLLLQTSQGDLRRIVSPRTSRNVSRHHTVTKHVILARSDSEFLQRDPIFDTGYRVQGIGRGSCTTSAHRYSYDNLSHLISVLHELSGSIIHSLVGRRTRSILW
jgi:hypothetical protein